MTPTLPYIPLQERVIKVVGKTFTTHRVVAPTDLMLKAQRVYIANEQRDGCFILSDKVLCLIEQQTSSFWEIDKEVKP